MTIRVGIDTGGTFTDLVALDETTGQIQISKRPSTPAEPARAVLDALVRSGVDLPDISLLVLGTTVGTNALLQRRGARVIYLTTRGVEDIPYIQRVDKKDPYDLQWQKPQPFVKRTDCLGVTERIASDGQVLVPLTEAELERTGAQVQERIGGTTGDVAIAVNLLFSYANSAHENALREFLEKCFPGVPISLSSQVAPLWREYERASTTIIDAALKPLMQQFIGDLETRLASNDFRGNFAIMKSNGGQMLSAAAKAQPVQTMLSGLSGGVIGGKYFGEQVGNRNVITFDMGGTSTDVATVIDGQVRYTTEYEIDFNLPVSAPFLDLKTIGAGGGSIAWVDKGGLLRVGPQSAGAVPGPVCYDLGGEQVTVTDANLILGRLDPDYFLGGEIKLNRERARAEMAELADVLQVSVEEAALAVVEIANENMANAIRVLTIDRGVDPREFALVGFGGAGPLHASEVAAALRIKQVIIPPHPGLTSALGTLVADLRVDKRRTFFARSNQIDLAALNEQVERLTRETLADLQHEGFEGTPVLHRTVSMRYAGQNYEREITTGDGEITPDVFRSLLSAFHDEHHTFYGYAFPDEVVEIVHLNVTALGLTTKPHFPKLAHGSAPPPHSRRQIYFRGKGYLDCPVYDRETLTAGRRLSGPAIIQELDSTTLVHPNQVLSVTEDGILNIEWLETAQDAPRAGARATDALDNVSLVIIHNNLVNFTREMGTAMMRTAYSPIFSESRDFSCALFDRNGEMIAQGEYCPAQLGAIPLTVKWTIGELGQDNFKPGDVVIHNDPYRGGCHMPEHMMLKPIFYDGKLVAFAAVIGHVAEIGGMAVGSFASNATEVFQEGLRLPPIKLMSEGEYVQPVWKIILANHRTPRNTWGDFHAMLGSLNVAERRVMSLMDKYGADYILRASEELLDYSERLMREEIRTIPQGEYSFEEYMEDDGITEKRYRIKVTVVVRDGEVLVDYTGSDPQAQGPINATYGVTASATYNAMLQITGAHIPRNAGCYRPIKIIAPPGTLVNVKYPGPSVGGNTETQPRIVGAILGALSQVLPEKVMAAEGATSCNFLFGGVSPKTGRFYTHYHFEASGWGGRYRTDGNSAQNHIHGNCRNTPIEIFESVFPFLVESYGLRQDSGGAGRQRGGLGIRRVLKVIAPQITVSLMMDHVKQGAWGAFGGMSGGLAGMWIKKKGSDSFKTFSEVYGTISPSKFANLVVEAGDEIMLDSAGGGGYGDPRERDPELVRQDMRDGFVSAAAAEKLYHLKVG